jgi:hypothetical protein
MRCMSEWVDAERSRGMLNAESGVLSKIQDVVFVACSFVVVVVVVVVASQGVDRPQRIKG